MTWRWRTCSEALLALCVLAPLPAATVSGKVRLVDSRERAVTKGDYSGVVVWLEPAGGPAAPQARRAEMRQKDKRFVPHVLAVTVGSTVDFPNYDPIFHNAFSNFSGQPFDVGLYPPGTSKGGDVPPGRHRAGVLQHPPPTMSAVIAVLRTPYFAVSQHSGAFEIAGVPPGEYTLRLFHERAAAARLAALERTVAVEGGPLPLGTLVISETGYLSAPHKNKYGQDYPPVINDRAIYPGAGK